MYKIWLLYSLQLVIFSIFNQLTGKYIKLKYNVK